jgi:hypothetical protein
MIGTFEATFCDTSGILPAQLSVGVRWNSDTSGPRALMLAVLEDAVQCIEKGRRRRTFRVRRLAVDAEAWVRCKRLDWPFSFINICQVLGFDADALRKHLLTTRNDASAARRVRVRAPIRTRVLTEAAEPLRVDMGGTR